MTRTKHQREIAVGTRVAFSREFLRNTGQFTGPVPFRRGVVIQIEHDAATVRWDGEGGYCSGAHVGNLWPADKLHLEPQ